MKKILIALFLLCILSVNACAESDTHLVEWYSNCSFEDYWNMYAGDLDFVNVIADVNYNGVAIGETLYNWKDVYRPTEDYEDTLRMLLMDYYGDEIDGYYINELSIKLKESELYGWGSYENGSYTCDEYYLVRAETVGGYWIDVVVNLGNFDGCDTVNCLEYGNAPRETMGAMQIAEDYSQYVQYGFVDNDMYVVNCNEWVSLRAAPHTSSACLVRVPLGSMVNNVSFMQDGFACCSYNGIRGYILSRYLDYAPMNTQYYGYGASVQMGLGGHTLARECDIVYLLEYSASSRLVDSERAYPASNLFDGNYDNAWADGVSGEGVGETIYAMWTGGGMGQNAYGIAIRNGYQKTANIYNKNSRPKDIRIEFGGQSFEARLIDSRDGWQSVIFDTPVCFDCEIEMLLTIDSVYTGAIYEDTCITEIDLLVGDYC